jgi:pimeloyl-ACP methyl ester carboxylesterase
MVHPTDAADGSDPTPVPAPDLEAEPDGFVVVVAPGDRIHFLDWGGPADPTPGDDRRVEGPPVVLVHGLAGTAWNWTPVVRRLRVVRRVVAMDLRGHGLSDAPTDDGAYGLDLLAEDVVAAAEGSGAIEDLDDRVVLSGHGFGGIVAAAAAAALGRRCAGLVLVDGGWVPVEAETGLDVDTFLRGLDEPPEVLASMAAFLADRAAFDPSSWDADQEHAARATIVETAAGRVVPVTRPHVLEACVRTMFEYDPIATLSAVEAPVTVLLAAASGDDVPGIRERALADASAARLDAGHEAIRRLSFGHDGHNLMRYRPVEVTRAILDIAVAEAPAAPPSS